MIPRNKTSLHPPANKPKTFNIGHQKSRQGFPSNATALWCIFTQQLGFSQIWSVILPVLLIFKQLIIGTLFFVQFHGKIFYSEATVKTGLAICLAEIKTS